MAEIKFFVEGKSDFRFLQDYIFHISTKKLERTNFVVHDGSTTQLIDPNLFQENTAKGGINIMIFDANGDINNKRTELLGWKTQLNIDFQLFLFPNNNDIGNLETLLENISLDLHKPIYQCFDAYEQCLRRTNADYTLPGQKARIYSYCETLLTKNKSKFAQEDKRDYLDPDIWNLNSQYLNPLKDFIERFI